MRFLRLLCATAGLLTIGATAFAQNTLNYDIGDGTHGDIFSITYNTASGLRTDNNVYAGPIFAHLSGTLPDPFTVYCVDLENFSTNPTTAVVTPVTVGSSGANTQYDPPSLGTYQDLEMASWLINNNTILTADQGAALQVAIWDVVDGQFTTTGTNNVGYAAGSQFYVSAGSSVINQANAYLAQLKTAVNDNSNGSDHGLSDGTLYAVNRNVMGVNGQDMLGGHGSPNPNAFTTPEGSSLLLLLPGLIPVAVGLRRRRLNTPVGE